MKDNVFKIYVDGNILFYEYLIRGNVDEVIKNFKYVVINIYKVFFVEYVYLELECVVVVLDGEDGLIVYIGI